jgi:carbon monoxide dehydrogenase subunit G
VQLNNSFTVPVPLDEAWTALMNVEEVAGCIPGASVDSIDGDDFTGRVKVRMGPILLTYFGQGRFVERSEADYRAVIEASGKETKGAGVVRAQTTATLSPSEHGTAVNVVTELSVTGKAAQFGRGMLEDVSSKIFDQFASALADQLTHEPAPAGNDDVSPRAASHAAAPRGRNSPEVLDLMNVAGGSLLRRFALPALIVAVLVALTLYLTLS